MNSDSKSNPDSHVDAIAALQARPAFRPSADWTRHLRPANAPVPDWAKPKPPAGGETSPISPNSAGGGPRAEPAAREASTASTISTPPQFPAKEINYIPLPPPDGVPVREHPIPEDSILADYRDFVRSVSEAPDSLIVAPILCLCAKLLTPEFMLDFGGRKPLTLYNFFTAPSGLRKSTTLNPAEKIARRILMGNDMIYGNASDSALFDTFEEQPHRLQFEDEGNTLLRTWETSAYGREVSARYLKLYDGTPWTQNFLRERKLHEGGSAERTIPQATLSLCIASTFGVARLDQLEAGSGLRRRFGFYLATDKARRIIWPETLEDQRIEHLADQFQELGHLKGIIGRGSFTPEGWDYWAALQERNHTRCTQILGYTSGEESLQASLNESPARCLKLAIIFQACRWAKGSIADPYSLTADVLALAEKHQDACLDALVELEATGKRAEVADSAEWLLAQIIGDHPGHRSAEYTRYELTRRFAANSGRHGALTTSRLYAEIIPRLIEQGHCHAHPKKGRLQSYTFRWE